MSSNAYTVYIIQELAIVCVMAMLLSLALPSIIKFFIAVLIYVPSCFLISHFIIRKIPFSTRVLG